MFIRKATENDLPEILEIYAHARNFMNENGNPTQWKGVYPPADLVEQTIDSTYLCIENEIIGCVFYFAQENDPTYDIIYNGSWLNNEPYGVVHRVASSHRIKGAARFSLSWAYSQCGNLKIDTHKDNIPMQNLLNSLDFSYCGIIHLANGEERLAYQKAMVDDIIEHWCPVCEEHFFTKDGEECPICGWVNDVIQELRPEKPVGANGISLNQFIEIYENKTAE